MGQAFFQHRHGVDHVELLAGAGRAGNDVDAAMAQAERFQHLKPSFDFLNRIGRERDADGIADPSPQHGADADGALHRAGAQAASLRDAKVQRIITGIRQALIGLRPPGRYQRLSR